MKPARKKPSKLVDHAVRDECDWGCAICREHNTSTHELHHIDGNPSNSVAENLLLLCKNCHGKATAKLTAEAELRILKSQAKLRLLPAVRMPLPTPQSNQQTTGDYSPITGGGAVNFKIINQKPKSGVVIPNSIVSSSKHYNYVEHLIKRLTEFRTVGKSFGQKRTGKIHAGVTRSILEKELGALPKNVHLTDFEKVCKKIQAKIDKTANGRGRKKRGQKNYSTFEEYLASGRG